MKVLLLGEFSALHKYLKEGLQQLGISTLLFSNGDSWKKISGADDILFRNDGNLITKIYKRNIEPCLNINKFFGYDVVQLINTYTFYPLVNSFMVKQIKKHNSCLSLCSCGYDTRQYQKYIEGFFEYAMLDGVQKVLDSFNPSTFKGKFRSWNDYRIEEFSDVVIPSSYEYEVGYSECLKVSPVIPFPINVDEIKYQENRIINDKIIFFHGLNREEEKGTRYIQEAFNKLKNNYPCDVEIIVDGHLPFDKYLEITNKANVIVDQCKSYGYGMNACVSMARGKVVMSGARKEALHAYKTENCPIIHISPNVEHIYSQMVHIIEHRNEISKWGYESRMYVEDLHDCRKVAQQYVDAWKSTGKL